TKAARTRFRSCRKRSTRSKSRSKRWGRRTSRAPAGVRPLSRLIARLGLAFAPGWLGVGPAEIVALEEVDALLLEPLGLGFGLDAFGDGAHLQTLRQAEERAHEDLVVGIVDQVLDVGAVDLHFLDAERAEALEARVAGAEIVERDGAAEALHVVA